jgi:hypothetical protein
LLQAAAVETTAPAKAAPKKSEFELYTFTTWLLKVRAAGSLKLRCDLSRSTGNVAPLPRLALSINTGRITI